MSASCSIWPDSLNEDIVGGCGLPCVLSGRASCASAITVTLFTRAISKGMLYIDTLVLARNAFPDMPNHKLSTLINELGLLDHEQEHRAMSDVEATQRLYMACKAQLVR